MTVFEKIESQQKGHEGTVGWCVGKTLKEICAADPDCARIVAEDLENPSMSIHECAKKNKANADENFNKLCAENRKNNVKTRVECVDVPPEEEERIIREFYGLPAAEKKNAVLMLEEEPKKEHLDSIPDIFDLGDDIDLFSL